MFVEEVLWGTSCFLINRSTVKVRVRVGFRVSFSVNM